MRRLRSLMLASTLALGPALFVLPTLSSPTMAQQPLPSGSFDRDREGRDRGFRGDRDGERGFRGDRDNDRDRDRGFRGDRDNDRDHERGFRGDRDHDRDRDRFDGRHRDADRFEGRDRDRGRFDWRDGERFGRYRDMDRRRHGGPDED